MYINISKLYLLSYRLILHVILFKNSFNFTCNFTWNSVNFTVTLNTADGAHTARMLITYYYNMWVYVLLCVIIAIYTIPNWYVSYMHTCFYCFIFYMHIKYNRKYKYKYNTNTIETCMHAYMFLLYLIINLWMIL